MTNVNDAAAWLAICKEEGQKIDPETAEVTWWWANELDPYGIHPDIEEDSINRVCFARRPDGDVWVCFSDLPTATVQRLEDRAARTLRSPVISPMMAPSGVSFTQSISSFFGSGKFTWSAPSWRPTV